MSNGDHNVDQPRLNGRPPEQQETNQSRAQRFEDEKQRIIEACFSKRDPEGMQLESYITHIRVLEDASYPSSPPPPDSSPSNKKHRVILVAVRRSGKVRVHKARENPNGSFSIGKTWNLDELTAIISYSSLVPANPQQQMEKAWASNTGFTVSLGKPYFWAAATAKEKDFFIASLIKIYRKYTGGKAPELIGFAPQEVQQLTGLPYAQNTPTSKTAFSPIVPAPTPPPNQQPFTPPPSVAVLNLNRPQSPYTTQQPPPSRDEPRMPPQEENRSFSRQDYQPANRDVIRPPSAQAEERSLGLLPRPVRRASPQEEPRPQQPYGSPLRQEDARKPSLTDNLQPAPLRPTDSPKGSQSSLPRSELSLEPQPLRPNGFGVAKVGVQESPLRKAIPATGPDTSRDSGRVEIMSSSRPSTATSDRRPADVAPSLPAPPPSLPALDFELFPEQKKPATKTESLGPPSQSNSTFVTPLATPSGAKEEEQQSKPDYFANEKSPPSNKQSQISPPVPPSSKPVYAQVTMPEPEALKATNEVVQPEPVGPAAIPKPEEEFRPGLGPMVKKKSNKDIADKFRKAALAATAFQPRQGGAGARLKAMQEKLTNEPDGVTSVVPAPLKRGMSGDSARSGTPDVASPDTEKDQPIPKIPPKDAARRVQIEEPVAAENLLKPEAPATRLVPIQPVDGAAETQTESPEKGRSASPQRKRRQKLEAEVEKHCTGLEIDPRLVDDEGADFDELMSELDWEGKFVNDDYVDKFEADIRREIDRAQTTGWLGHIEHHESRITELAAAFDKAIAECEELDGLLTLYAHELDTLHEDIEYIEAQGQGLQVQTANQKLLQVSLNNLLKTLSISSSDLRALQSAPLDSFDGVGAVERALALLYDAMLTIDPDLGHSKLRRAASTASRLGLGKDPEARIDKMRAVREKKDEYKDGSMMFVNRFNQHMKMMFSLAEQRTSEDNTTASVSSGKSSFTLNLRAYNASRQELWVYNAMMLFVREVNQYEWQVLISSYERNFNSMYQEQFREFAESLKRTVRPPTGEEQDILFTHQEKEKADDSNLSAAARKLTVKGRKPVKTSALRQSFGGDRRDGKPDACAIFDAVLEQQAIAISEEQNFIVHFFHLNSQLTEDFVEVINSQPAEQRKLPNLQSKLSYDPDRAMAKIVQNTTDGIYSFWPNLLQALMEWVFRLDALQGVGVIVSLEQCLAKYEETNQEFITRTVRTLHERITSLFHRFVEEQIRAIEDTKVKVKKRKGLISFMRVFPEFVAAAEELIPQEFANHESLEVRFIVNDAYGKLLKAMWESLNFIAKDNPAVNSSGGQSRSNATSGNNDPEDKEALNYHILLIENMSFFADTLTTNNNVVLEEWVERSNRDQLAHLGQYTDAVIRRPLGKWLDFLESTEALMSKGNEGNLVIIAKMPSHSKSACKKILGAYDAKEVRKGIDVLKKRIEKHFSGEEGESPVGVGPRRALVERVFDECAVRYGHAWDRMKIVIERVYEGALEIDWRKEDVAGLFKR